MKKILSVTFIILIAISLLGLNFLTYFPFYPSLRLQLMELRAQRNRTSDLYVQAESIKDGVKITLKFSDQMKNVIPTTGKGSVKEGYFREENGNIGIYFPGTKGRRFASISRQAFERYYGCPFIFVQNTVFKKKDIAPNCIIEGIVVIKNEFRDVPGTLLIVIPQKNSFLIAESAPSHGPFKVMLLKKSSSQRP